jgi:hypothetical protein
MGIPKDGAVVVEAVGAERFAEAFVIGLMGLLTIRAMAVSAFGGPSRMAPLS